MRIAMVTDFPFDPNKIEGGVAGVAVYLTRTLVEKYAVDLHVIAPGSESYDTHNKWQGMTIHRIRKSIIPGFLDYFTFYRKKVFHLLEAIKPDLTHFQGLAGCTIGYKGLSAFTVHGMVDKDVKYKGGLFVGFRQKIVKSIESYGLRGCKNVIIISPFVMDALKKDILFNKWQINNPVADYFFNIRRNVSNPVILFIGSVIPRKNVLGLIKAFRTIRSQVPNVILRIGGPLNDKRYFKTCSDYLEQYGLQEAVHFLGLLEKDKICDELAKASLFCLVSYQETAPLAIEEAMAVGVPVVASRAFGIPYLVEDEKTGALVDPDNIEEISNKIIEILNDKDRLSSMGKLSQQIAREKFHCDVVTAKTVAVYKTILNQNSVM